MPVLITLRGALRVVGGEGGITSLILEVSGDNDPNRGYLGSRLALVQTRAVDAGRRPMPLARNIPAPSSPPNPPPESCVRSRGSV